MALFKVTTLVQFKHDYFIEADCLEHAYDEVSMRESGSADDFFEETSQTYLGETIINGEASTIDEFDDYLEDAKNDDRLVCSYWMGDRLIRKIDYGDEMSGSDDSYTFGNTMTIRPYDNEFDFSYQDEPNKEAGHEAFKQMGTSLILGCPSIGIAGPKEMARYNRWDPRARGY